jgi:hypothetical protein
MAKKIRPPFDINKEFIIVKPFNYNGHKFMLVDPQTNGPMVFCWRRIACSPSELYKYWNLRWLECKSEENIKGVNFGDESLVIEKEPEVVPKKDEEVSKPNSEGVKTKKE